MVYAEIVVFVILAIAMFFWRQKAASLQSMTFGARLPVGCVVIECVLLLALALVLFIYRDLLQ